MRPGPARGTSTQREVVVDASMTDAGLATGVTPDLPPSFGTIAIAQLAAETARLLLLEHLEDGEIAVPGRLEIIHRSPIAVGTHTTFEATVQMVEPTRVTCEVLIRTSAGVAARASYEQEVVTRQEWQNRMATAAG